MMIEKKLELINEQTSPLYRIMWVYNIDEPTRKQFSNNISAFHIGKGLIMSVAHNLKADSGIVYSMDESIFQGEVISKLDQYQNQVMSQQYTFDSETNKRYLNTNDQNRLRVIGETFKQIQFDTRWVSLYEKKICKPYLIIQFTENKFYNDEGLSKHFNANTNFHESGLNRFTFLIELGLKEAFYSNDISLYKIVNTETAVQNKLPSIEVDNRILDDSEMNYYCLQSSPVGVLGRLLNKAKIEGYIDHHSTFHDKIGGNYTMEGTRYLIKGYFRFGSSGAPYVVYDDKAEKFKVNAVQSEASPIQLSINNNREGNYQYVNAIATPFRNIQSELNKYL